MYNRSIFGGLMVVNTKGEITYSYQEQFMGDHAPLEEVLNACKEFAPEETKSSFDWYYNIDDSAAMVKEAEEEGKFHFKVACSADKCVL
jgi:hypothetical protein